MNKELPDELRHALRAILRAATYLPDATARTYIRSHTIHRFRSVASKIKTSNRHDSEILLAKHHDPKRITRVWQLAHQLENAGHGSEAHLKKVLFYTYGRRGKRWRQLFADLLDPGEQTVPEDEAALQKLIDKARGDLEEDKPAAWRTGSHFKNAKLLALIKSQKLSHSVDMPKSRIKDEKPRIPKENIWGRPTPLRRQANITKKFWADTFQKLMPPLPKHEWERLRDLATGAIPIEWPLPRRTRVGTEVPKERVLLDYFSLPVNRQKSDIKTVDFGKDIEPQWVARVKPHQPEMKTLTTRYMRRLYATIWSTTPQMSQDEVTKQWTTRWGGARSGAHCGQVAAPSRSDLELFEGAEQVRGAEVAWSELKRLAKRKIKKIERTRGKGIVLENPGYTQGVMPVI